MGVIVGWFRRVRLGLRLGAYARFDLRVAREIAADALVSSEGESASDNPHG